MLFRFREVEEGMMKFADNFIFELFLLRISPSHIPPEVALMIKVFVYSPINDATIHQAVRLWKSDREAALALYGPIGRWDTSAVRNMRGLFQGMGSFNQNINHWNVSSVTDMSYMFQNAIHFNQPLNMWNVRNVQWMRSMFAKAEEFNQPLNEWVVSKVSVMSGMFVGARAFNQSLTGWDVSNVVSMDGMFYGATSFRQENLKNWNIPKRCSTQYMFE